MLRQTLVAVSDPGNIGLTGTLPGLLVTASPVVQGAQGAAGALLATVRVLRGEVPVAGRAVVAADAADECLAVTLPRHRPLHLAGSLVTVALVSRPLRPAVALPADVRVRDLLLRVLRWSQSGEGRLRWLNSPGRSHRYTFHSSCPPCCVDTPRTLHH